MGREILLKGDTINGKFLYEIETVSGTGASCVVYKARYCDDKKQSHLVQIKEFYPYNLEIYREKNSNNLICTDAEQFEFEKCRFINNAKKLASFNNDEITNSGTPFQVEIFETNNTAYSVVAYDAGDIYSEENLQTMELAKLLEIIKNLARAVELFHKNGYVHFDIKPENFLVDNTDHITLFDIDSVTSCDEIDNETIQNISHTKKWAAPEVRQAAEKGKNTNVSYTADIYSIGLILFEAIMCRDFIYPVETLPYSRNWDVENSIKVREEKQNRKVNINPKFYHKIKEIFEKTLDRNPNKRYNSAQELYDNLDKARDLLKENPWIIPSFRTVTPQFTGRKNELAKMNSILQKENTVFLHGFGGIGKSELALKYAEVYKDNFDTVVFCKYENSIKEALLNIRIANYENDSNAMTLRKFAELCDERTLMILDNFDVETDEDDYLDEFINNYSCKKIITTRTDFSELYTQIDVESLGQDDAILLFEKESKWIPKTEDKEKTLNEILKLIGYHTYFTVIFAKKKEMFSLSIDELKKQTEEMLLKKSGKVTVAKDGKLTTATVDAIAAKLFDFNSITESQKQTLRNLYMLSWRTVSRNDYAEIAGFGMSEEEKIELMDSLNDLTRLGWVLYNERTDDFFLHTIMHELVEQSLMNSYALSKLISYYSSAMLSLLEENEDKSFDFRSKYIIRRYKCYEVISFCSSLKKYNYQNTEEIINLFEILFKVLDNDTARSIRIEPHVLFDVLDNLIGCQDKDNTYLRIVNLKLIYLSHVMQIKEIEYFEKLAIDAYNMIYKLDIGSKEDKKMYLDTIMHYVFYFVGTGKFLPKTDTSRQMYECIIKIEKEFGDDWGYFFKLYKKDFKIIHNKRSTSLRDWVHRLHRKVIEAHKRRIVVFKLFSNISWIIKSLMISKWGKKFLYNLSLGGMDVIKKSFADNSVSNLNKYADFLIKLLMVIDIPEPYIDDDIISKEFKQFNNLAYIVMVKYVQNKKSLEESLSAFFIEMDKCKNSCTMDENLCVYKCLRNLYCSFCVFDSVNVILEFVLKQAKNELITNPDENSKFRIYELICDMANKSYEETQKERYAEIANKYAIKAKEQLGLNFTLKTN